MFSNKIEFHTNFNPLSRPVVHCSTLYYIKWLTPPTFERTWLQVGVNKWTG